MYIHTDIIAEKNCFVITLNNELLPLSKMNIN